MGESEVRFISGQDDFLNRRLFRRNDIELSLLLLEASDFETDIHRRFDISHVERVGDVLPSDPRIVKHREGGFLAVKRRNVFEQNHLRFVADIQVFQISDGLIIVRIDEVFLANDRTFSLGALLSDEPR